MSKFELQSIKVEYKLPEISYDLQPLKEQVETIKKMYENWNVQEKDLKDAKSVRAELNKAKKKIDRKRIDIKNYITTPLNKFENELKEIAKQVVELNDSIDSQVKDYETKLKQEKEKKIKSLDGYADFIKFNEKWLNKSYSMQDIKGDIATQHTLFTNSAMVITSKCDKYELDSEKYLNMLKNKVDTETIISMIENDYETKQRYVDKDTQEKVGDYDDLPFTRQDIEDSEILSYTLKIKGTRVQLKTLKQFMADNFIEYEKVEE